MYEKTKAWLSENFSVLLLAMLLAVGVGIFVLRSGADVPSDGNRADRARNELDEAANTGAAIEERIGRAEEAARRIEEGTQRNGELARAAEDLIGDCQRIVEGIRCRGEESQR